MKELSTLLKIDNNINKRVEEIKKKIITNKKLLDYCKKHNIELTEDKINNSLMNLIHFVEYYDKCEHCSDLETCEQFNPGFKPILIEYPNNIHLQYIPCDHYKSYMAQLKISKHIASFYMPKKILNASFNNIDVDNERLQAVNRVATFAKSYEVGKFQKGVYLTGSFGVGKTYLLAAMANALAKRHIKVALVYFPDMIRELKSAIGTEKLEALINEIKNVQVLILDDIGSEMNTQWVRDEILGPILQFRMLEELPTFFSSNKTINDLIKDYAQTNDHVVSTSKAERIGDRIRALADEIVMKGKNYRY